MFLCDKCGLCCRSIAGIEAFQNLDRGDGTCKYFDDKTNLCQRYESRPLLCRVDECYAAFFSSVMSREEYEKMNYDACMELKRRYGQVKG